MFWRRSDGDAGEPAQKDERPSIADLVRRLIDDARRLLRTEVAAAKAELTQKAIEASGPLGMMAGGALLATAGLLALVAAVIIWLAPVLGAGLSAFIVGMFCAGGGIALAVTGRNKLAAASLTPKRLAAALKEDAAAFKGDRP